MIQYFPVFSLYSAFSQAFDLIFRAWFLWLPILMISLFWGTWVNNARLKNLSELKWKLLQIKVPREVAKSPKAMEMVFQALYSAPRKGGWFKSMKSSFKGGLSVWHSLEIASIDGQIYFFVYLQDAFRNLFESQIYAQYSNIEITEVDDYTRAANFENLSEWDIWATELALNKEDPYPIMTYVDYGIHEARSKDAEEQKTDPLVSFLEFLGSLRQGEQAWFQILIKSSGKAWIDEGKKIIDDMLGRKKDPGVEETKPKSLSKGEHDIIAAIEKSTAKPGFDTGIRIVYVAKKEIFAKENCSALLAVLNQYNSPSLNGFNPGMGLDPAPLGFLYEEERTIKNKLAMLDAYRRRIYFNIPYKRRPFVLNTEELATIYHFPGRVAETPTFERVDARKVSPPANLPV